MMTIDGTTVTDHKSIHKGNDEDDAGAAVDDDTGAEVDADDADNDARSDADDYCDEDDEDDDCDVEDEQVKCCVAAGEAGGSSGRTSKTKVYAAQAMRGCRRAMSVRRGCRKGLTRRRRWQRRAVQLQRDPPMPHRTQRWLRLLPSDATLQLACDRASDGYAS